MVRLAIFRQVVRPVQLQQRTITLSAVRSMPARSENTENDPAKLEQEKHKQGDKATSPLPKGAPGWNETLASESEANVKAEQLHDGPPTEELQKQTAEHVQKKHQ